MRRLRILAALGAAALAAGALAGCTGGGSSGNVLRIGASATIDSLNPFVSSSDYSSVFYMYNYPHLTEYDTQDMSIVPAFATKWTTSDDGTTWTFDTVSGAKWSDDQPLTAEDAAFTLSMILEFQDGPTGQLAGFVSNLESAKADGDTLTLVYAKPVANVLAQLTQLPILPEHVWKDLATGDGKQISSFQNGAPAVSGGPFRLTQYKKDQLALFDVNPNWWGAAKPKIDGFGLQFFANDDAMVTALKTGQVDMIGESTPATAVETLKSAGMTVVTNPSTGWYNFIINTNPKKKHHPELLDPKVREAFEYAMDRQSMIDTAWLGYAELGSTIVAPATGFHDDQVQPLPFDVAKANEILDGLGYAKGSDGIRVANGVPMSYEVVFPTEINGAGDRMFQIIKNGLEEAGVKVEMRKMDPDAANSAILGDGDTYADFDLAMWDWIPPVDPDFQLSVLLCSQWGNNNDSGYCNPAYDKLYDEQGSAADEDARRAVIDQMQQLAFDERPYIVLLYQDVIEAHSPAWTGFLPSPLVGSVNNLSTQTLLQVHRVSK